MVNPLHRKIHAIVGGDNGIYFPRATQFLMENIGHFVLPFQLYRVDEPVEPVYQGYTQSLLSDLKKDVSLTSWESFLKRVLCNNEHIMRTRNNSVGDGSPVFSLSVVSSDDKCLDNVALNMARNLCHYWPTIHRKKGSYLYSQIYNYGKVSIPFCMEALYLLSTHGRHKYLFLKLLALEWFLHKGEHILCQTAPAVNTRNTNCRFSIKDDNAAIPESGNKAHDMATARRRAFLSRHGLQESSPIAQFLKLVQHASFGVSSDNVEFIFDGPPPLRPGTHYRFLPLCYHPPKEGSDIIHIEMTGILLGICDGRIIEYNNEETVFVYDGHTLRAGKPFSMFNHSRFEVNPIISVYDGIVSKVSRGKDIIVSGHGDNAIFLSRQDTRTPRNNRLSTAIRGFIGQIKGLQKKLSYLHYDMLYHHNSPAGLRAIRLMKRHRLPLYQASSMSVTTYEALVQNPEIAEAFEHFPVLFKPVLDDILYENFEVEEDLVEQYYDDDDNVSSKNWKAYSEWQNTVKPFSQEAIDRLKEAARNGEPLSPVIRRMGYNKTVIRAFLCGSLRTHHVTCAALFNPHAGFIYERFLVSGVLTGLKGKALSNARNHIFEFMHTLANQNYRSGIDLTRKMTPKKEWLSHLTSVKDTLDAVFTLFSLHTEEWDFQRMTLTDMGILGPENGIPDIISLTKKHHQDIQRFHHISLLLERGSLHEIWAIPLESWSCERGTITFIKSKQGLQAEGLKMNHCVGGYSNHCKSGRLFIAHVEGNDGTSGTLSLNGPGSQGDLLEISEYTSVDNTTVEGDARAVEELFRGSDVFRDLYARLENDTDFRQRFIKTNTQQSIMEPHEKIRIRENFIDTLEANIANWSYLFKNRAAASRYIETVKALHRNLSEMTCCHMENRHEAMLSP